MKLMFIGAAHEVTGSCHYIEACGKHILVDYGMEQGVNVFENVELPVQEALIDYVLLTHAHVDHSGMLPLLYARGFRGQVLTTEATADCVVSCFVIVPISRCRKQNGKTEKRKEVPRCQWWNRFIRWKMRMVLSESWFRVYTDRE